MSGDADRRLGRIRIGAFGVLAVAGFVLLFGPLLARLWIWLVQPRDPNWWGASGQWVGGIGTIGAVVVALWIAIRDGRVARADRTKREQRERQEQAAKVTAWIENAEPNTYLPDGSEVDVFMIVSNSNSEAINHVVVSFDIIKGLPMHGSYIHRHEDIEPDEFLYATLPPGKWRMPVRPGWRGMSAFPGVMLAFTDSRNCHWLRLADGTLIEKEANVIKRRKIWFPQSISVPESY
ncbi:hypothetical protein DMA12_27790 [Amycolatopsis balhimycina DSM 5908]|uniref:Uncharacterized protein n=1 Tax=Amycolatopsis balhimycina DSM 5908 TaxID=1081091 RepID=A0A428WBB8_AMYBA|nr:hypothetical protein [Amycolatopsis balhimycina]RSM40217.1 hypothetical protein DMA12_27790 [Amycolatopsis balhimycina DSM 5908]